MFDRDMRYVVASKRWADDYGGGRCDLKGMDHFEVLQDLPDKWKAQIGRGLEGELNRADEDVWHRADGSTRWLRWALGPWRNETGIAGIIIVAEDVTAIKQRDLELQESRKQLDALSAHLIKVREEERQRIAREIHDELGALLTGIQTHVGLTIDRMEQKGLPTGQLSEALALVDQATDSVRRVATELRPSVLDQLGVWAAIEWHGRQMQRTSKLPCAVKIGEGVIEHPLEPEQRIGLFRIVQEALTNIVRHARAHAAWIRARLSDGALLVEIEDDGVGIDDRRERARETWGIVGMQERARHFGWTLSVRRAPVRGTIVQVRIPLEVHHAG
jgi:PAS domain S-box-containing protein